VWSSVWEKWRRERYNRSGVFCLSLHLTVICNYLFYCNETSAVSHIVQRKLVLVMCRIWYEVLWTVKEPACPGTWHHQFRWAYWHLAPSVQMGLIWTTLVLGLILLVFNFYFPFFFCSAVKHSARPSTKLILTLQAKFRPYDVKMSHAMRIKVSDHKI
jgi:hypothetical protein